MFLKFVQDSTGAQWTDKAIRDSVAAIAKQSAYDRQLAQSLWDRMLRWVFQQLFDLYNVIRHIPHGNLIFYGLLVLGVGLIAARLIIGVNGERVLRGQSRRTTTNVGAATMLANAEKLANAGNYTLAAHMLFSALITVGASRGELRVHPSKTTGDYAGELRRRNASWLKLFQSFRARYDRVIYGDMQCSPDDYAALLQLTRSVLAPAKAA
ncbi:MAG: DUF4129 domain-containing protein [Gemmatimonadaceae bacterium]